MGAGRRQGAGDWVRWAWASVSADRPSVIELLLGRERSVAVFRRVASWWGTVVGIVVVISLALLIPGSLPGMEKGWALLGAILASTLGLTFLALGDRVGERFLEIVTIGSIPFMALELWLTGPQFEMGVVALALGSLQTLLYLRRRLAVAAHVLLALSYGTVVLTQPGYEAPWSRLFACMGVLVITSAVFGWVVGLIEELSKKERAGREELARTNEELAAAHAQLALRVDEQGEQIGSLQQLRQFLSPQVAEAVLQEGMDALAPHRARIAVVFCDLRGFTNFSSSAEPEEVMEVLDRYYVTVGRALHEGGATVGSFAGDGIMAYFGDPTPCEDAAGVAVEMVVDLCEQMSHVVAGWRRRGFDVGCGMGIAYGYATIGPVGFDERTDYTALGPTVNLASRLCGLAQDGEILIDGRAHEAVEHRVTSEERIVEVRGFRLPVHAYKITAWHGTPQLRKISGEG